MKSALPCVLHPSEYVRKRKTLFHIPFWNHSNTIKRCLSMHFDMISFCFWHTSLGWSRFGEAKFLIVVNNVVNKCVNLQTTFITTSKEWTPSTSVQDLLFMIYCLFLYRSLVVGCNSVMGPLCGKLSAPKDVSTNVLTMHVLWCPWA